ETACRVSVPTILCSAALALLGSLCRCLGILGGAEPAADLRQILLRLVQQAVQTDGGIVMRGRAERPEAEADIESRLAHGTVALVIIPAQLEGTTRFAFRPGHGGGGIADLQGICCSSGLFVGPRLAFDKVMVSLSGMKEE